ncbi:MAG TPA: signal peptide peptidase SppA [Candidatus Limnocylindrales bacterium]|nr:signal peptide peptidase SppA [Candidatus Limnocylindrales bacterium]
MASRRRTALYALGLAAGLVVLFLVTVWILIAVLDDGALPGGPRVAIVELEGVIMDADAIVRELREHQDNPSVRAVVVRVNSPGGVVAPTQEIVAAVQRVRKAQKPVVASLSSVAASGGYYVATAADRIFANPGTLTGSIGVVMQMVNVEGLLKKAGVDYVVVKAGRYKDVGNFSRAMTPEERRILQELLDDVYGQFVNAVAEGRNLDRETVLRFADGRIYSGQQAHRLKMVDELGGLEEAIEAAAKLAGIPGRPKLVYPRRRFSLMDLIKNQVGWGPVGALLPALPTLKTPLYLMD